MSRKSNASALLPSFSVAVLSSLTLGQTFTGLGVLPGVPHSYARAVSADGSTVVGWCDSDGSADTNAHAFRWTRAGGLQDLGSLGSGFIPKAGASAVNADGSVVVGWTTTNQSTAPRPFRWTAATGMVNLGTFSGAPLFSQAKARGVSADGSVVVGHSYSSAGQYHAFRWTDSGGMQDLGSGSALSGTESYGYAVSGDGLAVFGLAALSSGGGTRAARWVGGNWSQLGVGATPLTPAYFDYVYGTNSNGSVAVGIGSDRVAQQWHAFVWTPTGVHELERPAGYNNAVAFSVSDDGTRAVGEVYTTQYGPAVIWLADGPHDLNVYLTSRGIDLSGWELEVAYGISADGLVLCGFGFHEGHSEAWVADLHPACGSADFNCDGAIGTDSDIEAFFACLAGTCPAPPCASTADFNFDGDVGTDADIEAFFRVLAGGTC